MRTFIVTPEHLKLLQRAYISWDVSEFGAPCIDPKRPYGNSNVTEDIIEILDLDGTRCPNCDYLLAPQEKKDELINLHYDLQTVLQILTSNLSIKTGLYTADDYSNNWTWQHE